MQSGLGLYMQVKVQERKTEVSTVHLLPRVSPQSLAKLRHAPTAKVNGC